MCVGVHHYISLHVALGHLSWLVMLGLILHHSHHDLNSIRMSLHMEGRGRGGGVMVSSQAIHMHIPHVGMKAISCHVCSKPFLPFTVAQPPNSNSISVIVDSTKTLPLLYIMWTSVVGNNVSHDPVMNLWSPPGRQCDHVHSEGCW